MIAATSSMHARGRRFDFAAECADRASGSDPLQRGRQYVRGQRRGELVERLNRYRRFRERRGARIVDIVLCHPVRNCLFAVCAGDH